MSALAEAIEGLYRAFRRYPTPQRLESCDHCRDERDYHGLLTKPLRQLDADDLDLYVGTALTTCGELADFKHFLPRIFELMVRDDACFTNAPEALLGRLAYGGWRAWPVAERDAVEVFIAASWREMRRDPERAEPALCGIAQACDELEPFLAEWLGDTTDGAGRARAELVLDAVPSIHLEGRLPNTFWRKRPDQERTVVEWLKTAPVLAGYASNDDRVVLARQVLVGLQGGASAD